LSRSCWIETFTGMKFDILDPQPDMVRIEDIAHALSQVNRFGGHGKFPYPVSQHARLGSYIIDDEFAFDFLNHDNSEAYIGDMARPLKHFSVAGDEYRKVEAKIQEVIAYALGFKIIEPPEVKVIDNAMLYAEKEQIMFGVEWDYKWAESDKPADVKIVETSFSENKRLFLERFYQLENR
jgi:5'-deoxynucleotidase YfbR-like HD superfamily hydrolase